ncbi:MAG: response regulator transcription factor, partial [Candidatus Solibacter sp.]|nr:response regulator transcription factor [Candidatus Solibacter sp.]
RGGPLSVLRIALVDDHRVVARSLQSYLERVPDTGVRVIALTASMDEARMAGVLRAGAAGYVRKDADPEILLAAVRAVARGKTFIDPPVAVRFSSVTDELTRRELDVLRLLVDGLSNKEIAGALDVREETVKTHVANVLGKLHADNRAQAVAQALKRGLVD